jgi:hypothetical protein
MIFAAETEERSLHVFPDADTATAYCDGLDVEATLWRFWDDDGSPLEPRFTTPNKRGLFTAQTGIYHLIPVSTGHYEFLWSALQQIRQVIGESPFTDVRAVKEYLVRGSGGATSAV